MTQLIINYILSAGIIPPDHNTREPFASHNDNILFAEIITIIKDISVDEEALREQTKGKPKTDTNHANTDDRKNNNDGVGEDPYKDKDDDKKNEYVDPYKTETDPKKDEHKDNTNTNNNNHNKYKFVKRHDVVVEPEVGEDKENIRRREAVKKVRVDHDIHGVLLDSASTVQLY